MLFDIIYYVFISVIIILFFHFFYNYLKDNYTTKKIRYLGQFQNEKYQEIINELKNIQKPDIATITSTEKQQLEQALHNFVNSSM